MDAPSTASVAGVGTEPFFWSFQCRSFGVAWGRPKKSKSAKHPAADLVGGEPDAEAYAGRRPEPGGAGVHGAVNKLLAVARKHGGNLVAVAS